MVTTTAASARVAIRITSPLSPPRTLAHYYANTIDIDQRCGATGIAFAITLPGGAQRNHVLSLLREADCPREIYTCLRLRKLCCRFELVIAATHIVGVPDDFTSAWRHLYLADEVDRLVYAHLSAITAVHGQVHQRLQAPTLLCRGGHDHLVHAIDPVTRRWPRRDSTLGPVSQIEQNLVQDPSGRNDHGAEFTGKVV